MAANGMGFDEVTINTRVNKVVGIKKYQQVKQAMSQFDKFQEEFNKQISKVDHKIK